MFGLFPPKEAMDSKLIMLSFELCRLHQRIQDYRNAHMTMLKLVKVNKYIVTVLLEISQ